MILQEDHLRFGTAGILISLDLVVDLLEEGITGIAVGDIQGIRKQLLALGFGIDRTHQRIHQSGMQMHYEGKTDGIVHRSLHRRTAVFGDAGCRQVFFHLGLTLGSVGTVGLCAHGIELGAVQHCKTIFSDGGEGMATGLDPKAVCCLERSVAASGNNKSRIGPVSAGNLYQLIDFFHFF